MFSCFFFVFLVFVSFFCCCCWRFCFLFCFVLFVFVCFLFVCLLIFFVVFFFVCFYFVVEIKYWIETKLFSQKNSLFDNIPPTSATLKHHIRRAAFQASIIWGQALEQVPDQHCPEQWGWKKNTDGVLEIYWTDLSAISESCAELCKCGCKKQCSGKCSCKQSSLPCTSRCSCPCVD